MYLPVLILLTYTCSFRKRKKKFKRVLYVTISDIRQNNNHNFLWTKLYHVFAIVKNLRYNGDRTQRSFSRKNYNQHFFDEHNGYVNFLCNSLPI